jgi:hypothetical protein
VTIESGHKGKPVLWRAPAQLKEGEPLLKINNIEGLRIRGFTLDGHDRVKEVVTISGICPGFTLEDVQIQGYTGRGVTLINCEGRSDKPVRLVRVRILRDHERDIGLLFDALPRVRDGVNQHIVVQDCRIEGGGATGGVRMTSADVLRDVSFPGSPRPERVKPPNAPPEK